MTVDTREGLEQAIYRFNFEAFECVAINDGGSSTRRISTSVTLRRTSRGKLTPPDKTPLAAEKPSGTLEFSHDSPYDVALEVPAPRRITIENTILREYGTCRNTA